MRRFTGDAAFDDTLPHAEGLLKAGFTVNTGRLAADMGDWLTKKKGAGNKVTVHILEDERKS